MPIRAVTLDWGDTLATNHGQPYSFVHLRALQQLRQDLCGLGADLDEQWAQSCHDELHEQWRNTAIPSQNPEHREFDMLTLFESWVGHLRGDLPSAAIDEALDTFSATSIDNVCAYDGVAEALAELKSRGMRLGILSHIPWHRSACEGWLRRRGWLHYFDFLSLSSEIGWIKPHPAHYEHALEHAECAVEEVLHVGDHPYRDMDGGKEFGFTTCLRRTEGIYSEEQLSQCAADHVIAHVAELPHLVDSLNTVE